MELFKMARVRQLLNDSRLENVEEAVYQEIESLGIRGKVSKGDKVASGLVAVVLPILSVLLNKWWII